MIINNDYYNMPPREIDQAISWLNNIIVDAETKISKLQSLKSQNQALQNHRRKMNMLANEFDNDDFGRLDYDQRIATIVQRFGCTKKRAHEIYEIIRRRHDKRATKRRNVEIFELYRCGKSKTEIARQKEVSRQTVHRVIDDMLSDRLL